MFYNPRPSLRLTVAGLLAAIFLAAPVSRAAAVNAPTVITLTQTPCQFLEPEGQDYGYESTAKADCVRINADTGDARLANVTPMQLKPGKYVFRVTNRNVPYVLGFYLRGTGLGRLTLPAVSGGGLQTGYAQDYEIELTKGEYVYSCPLNPTPDYPIIVRD